MLIYVVILSPLIFFDAKFSFPTKEQLHQLKIPFPNTIAYYLSPHHSQRESLFISEVRVPRR
jgi:hypothetical protein